MSGRVLRALLGLAMLGAVATAAVAILGQGNVFALAEGAWSSLQRAPAPVYFGVMAIALIAPLPATAFYFAAGPLYGVAPALVWIALALALNALLVHVLAASLLRPWLASLVAGRGIRVPTLDRADDQRFFLLVMRITPGIPYFIQSWAIVLAGIDRVRFVLVSVCVQMFYATGFVVLGRAAFEGRFGVGAFAVAFLIAAGIAARWVHRRLRSRRDTLSDD